MKKLFKTAIFTLAAVLGLTVCLSGCKKAVKDGDQHLQIYCLNVGYGYEWVNALAKDFATLDYVKEKYPELTYEVKFNDSWSYASDMLKSGPASNTIDLFFSGSFTGLSKEKVNGKPVLADLTELYSRTIENGETYEEKMQKAYLSTNLNPHTNTYQAVSWASSIVSILYNKTILDKLGIEVPVTTDEMLDILGTVKGYNKTNSNYPQTYSIQASAKDSYWKYIFPVFWAQYEGVEEYSNFYKGISENVYSKNVFAQEGRRKALTVMDEMLSGNNGYIDADSGLYDFMEAQTNFIMRKGLFYACGDWFDYEMSMMSEGLANQGYNDTIGLMKTPVISSIIDKTTSINTDELLAEVIRAIDSGAQEFEEVLPEDFETIKNARQLVKSIGPEHQGVVPDYASAKELAIDFLEYMATDRANLVYAKATNGANLPFKYVTQAHDPEFYQTISQIQKDRANILTSDFKGSNIMPVPTTFPLVYNAGLMELRSLGEYTIEQYLGRTGANRATGEDLYYADIEYWTQVRWEFLLANA